MGTTTVRSIPVKTVAALFVMRDGIYWDLEDVDPWDAERDARFYAGPFPVIAHPPCARWGRYWGGGPLLAGTPKQKKLGDDNGCFAAALEAVRTYGGVLEHPEGSHAWRAHELNLPPRSGGWVNADFDGGWTCCVEQGAYGHSARKATWLFACGVELSTLKWGKTDGDFQRIDDEFCTKEARARRIKTGACQRLSKNQRMATPIEFRDLLLSIARSAK